MGKPKNIYTKHVKNLKICLHAPMALTISTTFKYDQFFTLSGPISILGNTLRGPSQLVDVETMLGMQHCDSCNARYCPWASTKSAIPAMTRMLRSGAAGLIQLESHGVGRELDSGQGAGHRTGIMGTCKQH